MFLTNWDVGLTSPYVTGSISGSNNDDNIIAIGQNIVGVTNSPWTVITSSAPTPAHLQAYAGSAVPTQNNTWPYVTYYLTTDPQEKIILHLLLNSSVSILSFWIYDLAYAIPIISNGSPTSNYLMTGSTSTGTTDWTGNPHFGTATKTIDLWYFIHDDLFAFLARETGDALPTQTGFFWMGPALNGSPQGMQTRGSDLIVDNHRFSTNDIGNSVQDTWPLNATSNSKRGTMWQYQQGYTPTQNTADGKKPYFYGRPCSTGRVESYCPYLVATNSTSQDPGDSILDYNGNRWVVLRDVSGVAYLIAAHDLNPA